MQDGRATRGRSMMPADAGTAISPAFLARAAARVIMGYRVLEACARDRYPEGEDPLAGLSERSE